MSREQEPFADTTARLAGKNSGSFGSVIGLGFFGLERLQVRR